MSPRHTQVVDMFRIVAQWQQKQLLCGEEAPRLRIEWAATRHTDNKCKPDAVAGLIKCMRCIPTDLVT